MLQKTSNDLNNNLKTHRDLDPNVRQRRASDPFSSVWVGASAGTGKTKVLTDRVLRLLLPRSENKEGTPPHKILCLTFTKAAASEMALRINGILADWAILPDTELYKNLEKLIGRPAHKYEIEAARKLFAQVIDTPGGLKIMTIHSFCQSILGRFPLEAGIRPNFEVLDEATAKDILQQARDKIYSQATQEKSSALSNALYNIASTINEDQFLTLLRSMASEKMQLKKILGQNWNVESFYLELCQKLNITPNKSLADIKRDFCLTIDEGGLREAGRALFESTGKTDIAVGGTLLDWLNSDIEARIQNFETYKLVFLKQDGEPRAKLMGKAIGENNPALLNVMQQEQERLVDLKENINKNICTALTRDLFFLGQAILKQYQKLKASQGFLDYDDLINTTSKLLDKNNESSIANMPSWVLYKLDQGLDHILVDEAQDTNPEQWTIIKSLCEEFFSTLKEKDEIIRTIFVVGDEKQSIYSFQRASPEEFETMQNFFTEKVTQTGHTWNNEALNISFRSSRSVLEAVDMVFAQKNIVDDPGFANSEHISFRSRQNGQGGLVELWPIFENEEKKTFDPWDPPVEIIDTRSGANLCATHIAETIDNWIGNKELESHDRTVEAGDIMILVRTRTAFVNQMIRALKLRGIPVSGHDRMILNEQLAVQDLLALAEFSLLPDDDLTLACLLKSPLIGLSEDELYNIAIDRTQSLWDALKSKSGHKNVKDYLENFIQIAKAMRPYEFFAQALSIPCPADDQSGLRAFKKRLGDDCLDPIDEFVNASMNFEEDNIPNMQYFIQWQQSGSADIKRELEESAGQVRIMTVHGSKGLQSPIVILPDTIRTSRHVPGQIDKRLLWPHKTNWNTPLWSPRKDLDFNEFKETFQHIEDKADEEYRRLLYVAMTRAEDQLYVTGYKGSKTPIDECWYNYIQNSLSNDNRVVKTDDGILRLFNKQEGRPDRISNSQETKISKQEIPDWIFTKAPSEPSPPQPLMPSRPSEADPATLSPLKSREEKRFKRGNITHKLLQFLPTISEKKRATAAQGFLKRYAHDLNDEIQNNIIEECFAILEDKTFKPLFGPSSFSEVPITGLIKNTELISGQIDRLLITQDKIWIIDFKTNRPPPRDPNNVPAIYQKQMQAYYDTLKEIYPKHEIHCGLIWTDGPFLMEIKCQ